MCNGGIDYSIDMNERKCTISRIGVYRIVVKQSVQSVDRKGAGALQIDKGFDRWVVVYSNIG